MECNLGTLDPDESATVTIVVEAQEAGTASNTAMATAGDATDSDTETTRILPDLEIEKLDDPDPVTGAEDLLLYTLRVQNQGDTTLDPGDVAVTDELPLSELDFVTLDSNDFNCQYNAGLVQCNSRIEFGPGQVGTIEIVVEPEVAGTIQNTAAVFARDADGFSLIDTDTERTLVEEANDDGNDDGVDDGDNDNDNNDDDNFDDDFDDGDFFDEDIDEDEDLESDLEDAEEDLEALDGEITDGEGTDGDDLLDDSDDSGVSATADEDGAEASTPGASASAGGDPDEQAPVSDPQGDVVDDVVTSGPLPNTGGVPVAAGTVLAMVLFGAGLLVVRLVMIWRGRRA